MDWNAHVGQTPQNKKPPENLSQHPGVQKDDALPSDQHYTAVQPAPQSSPRSWLVEQGIDYRSWLGTCPNAQTLLGDDPDFRIQYVIPLLCKQWGCRFCAAMKCRRLAARTRDAKPNRMLTLTVDPSLWKNPREAFDGTRRHVPTLMASLRKRFGPIDYLRVTELTAGGWPHYHFLLRSDYLPQPVVKAEWQRLTGAKIVDVRQVLPKWNAYTYLLKYLCKLSNLGWTERHVSTSKDFFPPEPKTTAPKLPIQRSEKLAMHPNTYLRGHAVGSFVARLTPSIFAVSTSLNSLQEVCDVYATGSA